MFNGNKFEALSKNNVGVFIPPVIDDEPASIAWLINQIDQWALRYGYEFHAMTNNCVMFKRVGG